MHSRKNSSRLSSSRFKQQRVYWSPRRGAAGHLFPEQLPLLLRSQSPSRAVQLECMDASATRTAKAENWTDCYSCVARLCVQQTCRLRYPAPQQLSDHTSQISNSGASRHSRRSALPLPSSRHTRIRDRWLRLLAKHRQQQRAGPREKLTPVAQFEAIAVCEDLNATSRQVLPCAACRGKGTIRVQQRQR